MIKFDKDPDSILDYKVNWSAWLAVVSDTIATSDWILPSDLSEVSRSNNGTNATIFLAGGTAGQFYMVTNRIVTVGGRTADRSFNLNVVTR